MNNKFNLSEWALRHRSLIWYFMLVSLVAGFISYQNLGREEDPNFTIKTMLIAATWPGATALETSEQVTERIERKLEELETLKFTRSLTTAGQSVIYVDLLDTARGEVVTQSWARVRNMINDIQYTFPAGVVGPFFNDNFGDVYGNIYAFTSDGLTERELRDRVEEARSKVLNVPNVGQMSILGAREEKVFLEFSTDKLASLGLNQQQVENTLQAQTTIQPSGVLDNGEEKIWLRVGGQSNTVEELSNINLRVGEQFIRLNEIATVRSGYADPPSSLFRFKGEPAIGLAIGMKQGANLLDFGAALDAEIKAIQSEMPLGVTIHKVADQPETVKVAIGHFTKALVEAIAIVLAISFVSLGVRAGLVVTVSIPLVLAITFIFLDLAGITLQRISLGALIISLGLLVDDAMIAVEMMIARLEVGDSLNKAATHVYTSTAFPMLTGTLVTVAGFIPIGLNSSSAGEFTFTLFVVIGVSLIVSWVVAVLFTPLLGVTLLPEKLKHEHASKGWFARFFSALLGFCLRFKWLTIMVTIGSFMLSIYALQFVQQEFFPSSDRPELIVEFQLRDDHSIKETDKKIKQFEQAMLKDNEDVVYWSSYVGNSAPRFLLTFEGPLPSSSVGQIVVLTPDLETRNRVRKDFQQYIAEHYLDSEVSVKLLALGPPTGKPVQYRISGSDTQMLRERARELGAIVAANPNTRNTGYDWIEPARVIKATLLANKAQQLNVSPADIASALNNASVGNTITQVRDDVYLIDVVARVDNLERASIDSLKKILVNTASGAAIPIESLVVFSYELEQPVIWKRSRQPTITVKADAVDGVLPATIVAQLEEQIDSYKQQLPRDVKVVVGGAVEDSAGAQGPIAAAMPVMLFIMATILMIQLQSFNRLFLVFAVAPFALVGVVIALLPAQIPMGFVAILGILALIGILIRNSVILIVQIEDLRGTGLDAWTAVVEATEHRMRPILLTAAAASLALIPISQDVFWGPMAYAMMGGIIVGTVLTLLFLPALYLAWFRIARKVENS